MQKAVSHAINSHVLRTNPWLSRLSGVWPGPALFAYVQQKGHCGNIGKILSRMASNQWNTLIN